MDDADSLPTKRNRRALMTTCIDWRDVAHNRLATLVILENELADSRKRFESLQIDYRKLMAENAGHTQRAAQHVETQAKQLALDAQWVLLEADHCRLQTRQVELEARHARLADEYALIVASRSWRVTRPLRALSSRSLIGKNFVARLLRAMLAVPMLRMLARFAARLAPGFGNRIRSKLYP